MNAAPYWLCRWIDEEGIQAEWETVNALKSDKATGRLYEVLHEAADRRRRLEVPSRADVGDSIVAGSGIDLSGSIGCGADDCLRGSIDGTFKNIWHYFDCVVVEGLDPLRLADGLDRAKSESAFASAMAKIADQVNLVLYLRETGADKTTIFANKP